MDNRAATILLIAGLSFVFWLHNTDRLSSVVNTIKSPVTGGGGVSPSPSSWDGVVPLNPFGFGTIGAGLIGSVNK